MDQSKFTKLLDRYQRGEATPDEITLLESWYLHEGNMAEELEEFIDYNRTQERIWDNLAQQPELAPVKRPYRFGWKLGIAAAAAILIIVCGLLFNVNNGVKPDQLQVKTVNLPPGGNRAVLMLANGQKIVLTGAKNGYLAKENNASISKTADGQIVYQAGSPSHAKVAYNTMITPRGGQYALTLSDGTKVILNAASSLKYPTSFQGKERSVELLGEAFFEVAPNKAMPFSVHTAGQVVEVLGTHFNINAYPDEASVKTTLLEGSVKVTAASGLSNTIKPGQQIQLQQGKMTLLNVDTEEAVAWKNGLFYFNDADLKTVMRQLSRWYDVDIEYDGEIPSRRFSGQISKTVDATQLIEILSFKRIHYSMSNKTILIKSK